MNNHKIKIVIIASLLLVIGSLLALPAPGQTANYYGRTYTPQSFPRAEWCSCPMCQEIRRQWSASTPVVAPTPQDDEYETVYRDEVREVTETRYRQEKRCTIGLFGRKTCYTVNVPYQVKVKKTVRVPVKRRKVIKPIPDPSITVKAAPLLPTPREAVKRILEVLKPRKGEILIDAGCGDGRFLIEAANVHGCTAIGVEIDPATVKVARNRIRAARSRAIVIEGDALKFDYSQADTVIIYQFPDLTREIVARLPRGVRVASYMHDLPGIRTRRYTVQIEGKKHYFYVGTVGSEKTEKSAKGLTFGL